MGVPCSAPDEALEHIGWASLLFPKIFGSSWAQMLGKKGQRGSGKNNPDLHISMDTCLAGLN